MKRRADEVRFNIGESVEINSCIMTRFAGCTGNVIAVAASKRARNLDKYTVRFDNGEEREFWDVQLRPAIRPTDTSTLRGNVQQYEV